MRLRSKRGFHANRSLFWQSWEFTGFENVACPVKSKEVYRSNFRILPPELISSARLVIHRTIYAGLRRMWPCRPSVSCNRRRQAVSTDLSCGSASLIRSNLRPSRYPTSAQTAAIAAPTAATAPRLRPSPCVRPVKNQPFKTSPPL